MENNPSSVVSQSMVISVALSSPSETMARNTIGSPNPYTPPSSGSRTLSVGGSPTSRLIVSAQRPPTSSSACRVIRCVPRRSDSIGTIVSPEVSGAPVWRTPSRLLTHVTLTSSG